MSYSFDSVTALRLRRRGRVPACRQAGFITICTANREHLFGEITDGAMRLNDFGVIARDEWINTSVMRPDVILDEFVMMPNHIHGIVMTDHVCAIRADATANARTTMNGE